MSNADRGGTACSKQCTITATGLRYRSGPSTSYKILGTVTKGKDYKATYYKGGWYYFPSIDGWSSSTNAGKSTMTVKNISSNGITSSVTKDMLKGEIQPTKPPKTATVNSGTTKGSTSNWITSTESELKTIDTEAYNDARRNLISEFKGDSIHKLMLNNGLIPKESDLMLYSKFNRIGFMDINNTIGTTREYVFFVKPDLHILEPGTNNLNAELEFDPFFIELRNRWPKLIRMLQSSAPGDGSYSKYIPLLSDKIVSSLSLPGITADVIETPQTIYGTSINYRGEGLKSDEKYDFSLEFEDTKYLEVYMFFKAYEEYSRLKKKGIVSPTREWYRTNKILYDQMGTYKIIVGEDGETIIHYSYFWGVFPKSVPRDSFSDMSQDGILKYSVDFEAQFVDDMNPLILRNFNNLTASQRGSSTNPLPVYDTTHRMVDATWGRIPYVHTDQKYKTRNGFRYKLKWLE